MGNAWTWWTLTPLKKASFLCLFSLMDLLLWSLVVGLCLDKAVVVVSQASEVKVLKALDQTSKDIFKYPALQARLKTYAGPVPNSWITFKRARAR